MGATIGSGSHKMPQDKETFDEIYAKLNQIDKLKREIMELVSQLEQDRR